MKPKEKDIRRYPRMTAEYHLSFHPENDPRIEPVRTRTKVIGLGGLMFESDSPLEVGGVFHFRLTVQNHHLEVNGKVVYANITYEGPCQIGVEFTDLSEEDREFLLHHYMRERYQIDPGQS
jgi:hypothetical protein